MLSALRVRSQEDWRGRLLLKEVQEGLLHVRVSQLKGEPPGLPVEELGLKAGLSVERRVDTAALVERRRVRMQATRRQHLRALEPERLVPALVTEITDGGHEETRRWALLLLCCEAFLQSTQYSW